MTASLDARPARVTGRAVPRAALVAAAIGVAVGAWIARLPMAEGATVGLGLLILWLERARLRANRPRLLGTVAVVALTSSALGALGAGGTVLTSDTYVSSTARACVLGVVVFCAGDLRRNVSALAWGLIGGFTASLLIALAELATGFRIIARTLGPGPLLERIQADPWLTAALFANFNDLTIALALLAVICVSWLLFHGGSLWWQKGLALLATAASAALIVVMGSRGALLGLLVGCGLAVLLAVRATRSTLLTPARLGLGAGVLALPLVLLWRSPYLQDSSTLLRERIANDLGSLLADAPWRALTGFGSEDGYHAVAAQVIGTDVLMDPHNVILDLVVRYGVVGAVVVLGATAVFGLSTLAGPRPTRDWRTAVFAIMLLLTPVLGVVPSSYLDYPYLVLALIGAGACDLIDRGRGASAGG